MDLTIELLLAALGCIGGLALYILAGMGRDIRELSGHVFSLNQKMAVIVERIESHETRLKGLERRRSN